MVIKKELITAIKNKSHLFNSSHFLKSAKIRGHKIYATNRFNYLKIKNTINGIQIKAERTEMDDVKMLITV